jgi:hypothetical protein
MHVAATVKHHAFEQSGAHAGSVWHVHQVSARWLQDFRRQQEELSGWEGAGGEKTKREEEEGGDVGYS